MIKAVAFDLDNTLVRSTTDFPKMRRMISSYIHKFASDSDLIANASTTIQLVDAVENGNWLKDRERHLKKIYEIMDRIELESVERVVPMTGAADCLTKLRNMKIKIGVLTRACPTYVRAALETAGLLRLVDDYVARTVGEPVKPDPRSAVNLAKKLGVRLEEMIIVGDHESDAQCAKSAKIPFIQLAAGHDPKPLGAAAIITSLEELPSAIVDLSKRDQPDGYRT